MSDSPYELWNRAAQKYPHDSDKRKKEYHDLMVEAGYIVKGNREPLPCGWPKDKA